MHRLKAKKIPARRPAPSEATFKDILGLHARPKYFLPAYPGLHPISMRDPKILQLIDPKNPDRGRPDQ
jgi:hypothetical protein